MPHGITQCYLPPGRGDIPALTQAEAGTRLSDSEVGLLHTEMVTNPGTNRARRALTDLSPALGACVLGAQMSSAKTAEPIEMPLGAQTRVSEGVQFPLHEKGHFL